MVSQSGSRSKIQFFWQFLKFCIQPPVSVLLHLILFYVLYGLVLFRKGDFNLANISRMIFKGGILGGARNFHLDSYLNGTTIPFDIHYYKYTFLTLLET